MIVKKGETKPITIQNATIDGLRFNVYLQSSANDQALSATDFLPVQVTVMATLVRGGR